MLQKISDHETNCGSIKICTLIKKKNQDSALCIKQTKTPINRSTEVTALPVLVFHKHRRNASRVLIVEFCPQFHAGIMYGNIVGNKNTPPQKRRQKQIQPPLRRPSLQRTPFTGPGRLTNIPKRFGFGAISKISKTLTVTFSLSKQQFSRKEFKT